MRGTAEKITTFSIILSICCRFEEYCEYVSNRTHLLISQKQLTKINLS